MDFFMCKSGDQCYRYWDHCDNEEHCDDGSDEGGACKARYVQACSIKCDLQMCSTAALCSRHFQNVNSRLDFVEIRSFYCHSDFTRNQILANSNGPKMSF